VLLDWDPRYLYRKMFNGDEEGMERFLAEVDFFTWNLQQDEGRTFAEGVTAGCAAYPQYCKLLRAYDERWAESISGTLWGTVEILERLKAGGYSLFGLSNWSAEKFDLVRPTYPFLGYFEKVVLSGEVKILKPDPRIFQTTLDAIGQPAGECLLIDDSQKNIEAAIELGFQTIHFQSPEQLRGALAAFGIVV
jgi:2-haloacid dehalogenase